MIAISKKENICFVVVRRVNNKPGMGAIILESLKEARINIENLQVIADPKSKYEGVIMMAINKVDVKKTLQSIEKAIGEADRDISVIKNLIGVTIRGITIANSTDILHRVFKICGKLKINVAMSYTTLISLSIYVQKGLSVNRLIKELNREFEEE